MKNLKTVFLTPLLLVFILLLDGQISTFLAAFLPLRWHLVCHMIFIYMIFISVNLTRNYTILLFLFLGLIYDVYYFHTIGIAVILFPLMSLLVSYANSLMLANRLMRFLSVMTLVFVFELISFVFAHFLGLTLISLQHFVIYSLLPTLLFNCLLLLFIQPLFEKVYL